MRFWQPFVFLRYVLFMVAGILLGEYISWATINFAQIILALMLITYVAVWFLYRNNKYRYKLLGVLGLLVFAAFGLWRTLFVSQLHEPDHYRHQRGHITAFEAVLYDSPMLTPSGMKAEAFVERIRIDSTEWQPATGKILLRWFVTDSTLNYGDKLLIAGRPDTIKASTNPDGLDYKAYLFRRQIYALKYLYDKGGYARSGYAPPSAVMAFAVAARQFCQRQINTSLEPAAQPLMEALLLGVKDRLSIEVRQAFSAAGAMHVLAVSGLHVGIVYGVILLLLRYFDKTKTGKWITLIISLLALWLYAFITGLAPSVMRAALMFSVLAIGKTIFRQRQAYNTLALSAFILLVWNPWLIFNMGFQFSYLAVLGILYIQPKFAAWYAPRNIVDKYLWGGFTVSMAAQIAVSPLSLAYFHQFPNYFPLTNIVALALAALLVYAGVAFLIVSSVHQLLLIWFQNIDWFGLEKGVGWLLEKGVFGLESSMRWAETLPGSVAYIGWISKQNVPYIYFALLMFLIALHYKKMKLLRAAVIAMVVSVALQVQEIVKDHKEKVVVYATGRRASAVSLVSAGELKGFVEDLSDEKTDLWHFAVQEHWKKLTASRIDTIKTSEESKNTRFYGGIRWAVSGNGQLTAIVHEPPQLPALKLKMVVDRLVVGNEAVSAYHLKKLTESLIIKELIIEESYSPRKADYLVEAATKLNISVHSISNNGAYVAILD